MTETQNIERDEQRSPDRILPRVEEILKSQIRKLRLDWEQFSSRLHRNSTVLLILQFHAAQIQHFDEDHYHEK